MSSPVTQTHISIVIPVYSGEEYLRSLLKAIDDLHRAFEESGLPLKLTECLCVSDAAIDRSESVLDSLKELYPWLRVLTLSRNFGQHPATVAGILYSSGDWVVTLDEDLQHDPKHIPKLLYHAALKSLDTVYAHPKNGTHSSLYRDTASRSIKHTAAMLAGNPHILLFNSFRLIRGSVARSAAASCASETYFDVALTWFTQRIGSVKIEMSDRRTAEGKASGYRFRSLVRHATRLLITSDSRLLRFGARLGAIGVLSAIILVVVIVAGKILYPNIIPVQGWASTMVMILAVNGLVGIQCGLAMKYLSLILQRSQGRPTFFVVNRSGDEKLVGAMAAFLKDAPEATDN